MGSPDKGLKPERHLKRVAVLIACLVVLVVALVSLQTFTAKQDVHTATRALIAQSLSAERDDLKEDLERLTKDYAHWGEAYDNAIVTQNEVWLRDNYDPYLRANFNVAGVFLVYVDGRVFQIRNGHRTVFSASQRDVMPLVGSLRDLSARVRTHAETTSPDAAGWDSESTFVRYEGNVAVAAASLVQPQEENYTSIAPDKAVTLVLVRTIDRAWVSEVAGRLSIRHLSLSTLSPDNDPVRLEVATGQTGPEAEKADDPAQRGEISFNDIQDVPLAHLQFIAPDLAPDLASPVLIGGAALIIALLIVGGLLIRQTLLAMGKIEQQNYLLHDEVFRREQSERDLAAHKAKLEQTVETRSRALNREAQRTNILLHDLELSLERMQRIIDTSSEGFMQIDLAGRIISANQRAQRMLGFDARELIGRSVEFVIAPDSRPLLHEQLKNRESAQTRNYVVDMLTKDGAMIPVEIVAANEYENGTLSGSFAFFRDVRAQMQQSKALEDALREAQDTSRDKAEFLALLGHEMRAPLNAILGFTQLLLCGGSQLASRQQDQVRRIHQAGEVLATLINESMDLARIESGDVVLSSEPVNATGMIEDVLRLGSVLANQMGVTLRTDSSVDGDREQSIIVRADQGRLRQVLLHLVSNGIRYNRPGGEVILGVGMGDGPWVCFKVRDTGIGIPQAMISSLSHPFKRGGSDKGANQGSGLGLALTYRLVRAMGGRVEVGSTVGEGSEFCVEMPVTSVTSGMSSRPRSHVRQGYGPHEGQSPSMASAESGACLAAKAGTHVLLVMGQERERLSLRTALVHRCGYQVVDCASADEALQVMRTRCPDLIVLDAGLSDMDGDAFLTTLRRDPAMEQVKVVVLGVPGNDDARQRLERHTVSAHLSRPLNTDIMVIAIMRALVTPADLAEGPVPEGQPEEAERQPISTDAAHP